MPHSSDDQWLSDLDTKTVARIVAWLRTADDELREAADPVGAGALVDLALAAQAIERRFLLGSAASQAPADGDPTTAH